MKSRVIRPKIYHPEAYFNYPKQKLDPSFNRITRSLSFSKFQAVGMVSG